MPSLLGNSFFIRSVARESVFFLFLTHTVFCQTIVSVCSWILVLLGSSDEGFFSVLVVNDGDSEIVSFFGRASFVLYLRSVEDRMRTWDQQKCVNALHALLVIGSTNATIDVLEVLMHEQQFVFNLCQQHHIAMHQLNRPVFSCCFMFC